MQFLPVLSSLAPLVFNTNFHTDFQQLPSTSWLSFLKPLSKSFQVPNSTTEPMLLHMLIVTKVHCWYGRPSLPRRRLPPNWVFNLVPITTNLSFFEGSVSIFIISYTVVHQIFPICISFLSSYQGKNLKVFFNNWHLSDLFTQF